MVGYYLRALVGGPLEGFVRLFAVHHVASLIWPDLQRVAASRRLSLTEIANTEKETAGSAPGTTTNDARSKSLLLAVFKQGQQEIIHDIVRYSQPDSGSVWVTPACFNVCEELKKERVAFVKGDARTEEAVARILGVVV